MNRPANHPAADLVLKIEWKRGTPWFKGKPLHYDTVAARLWASELQIEAFQKKIDLLEAGSAEMVLELARQRGTITALQEQCRDYAQNSD